LYLLLNLLVNFDKSGVENWFVKILFKKIISPLKTSLTLTDIKKQPFFNLKPKFMIITLDIFSGRPNPTFNLDEKNAKKFVERFAGKSVLSPENVEAHLGFRGFIVDAATDVKLPDNIPTRFHVGGVATEKFNAKALKQPLLSADENDDAVKWLLSKAKDSVNAEIFSHIKDTLSQRKKAVTAVATLVEDLEWKKLQLAAACIIANTPYNPGFWNNDPFVKSNNNCYNYAMNWKSNTFAQPGRKSGHQYTPPPTCTNVKNSAVWDGLLTACSGSVKNVALVIWPGVDYHWYRRHSEGFWGHKPGSTAARNVDSNNNIINGTTRTPANCARGNYTIFCGYYYSPTGMSVN
jgi:hypothetical protein